MAGKAAQVVAKLRQTFASNKTLPMQYRVGQLNQVKKFVNEKREAIYDAIYNDLGRGKCESDVFDIAVSLNEIKCHLSYLGNWMKPQKVSRTMSAALDNCYTVRDPLGVILNISPWNFPIQLSLLPLIGAISGGNCAVLKPSELAAHTSRLLAEQLPNYLDTDAYQVIEGGVPETTELLKQRFDHIFYTGAPGVGKIVMRAAAENLTPVTLELGGKCPCILDKGTDLKIAARRISWGKWANNGQICLAVDYVLLIGNKAERDILVQELKKTIDEFYQGNIKKSDYTRIISERHFDRIKELLEKTKGTKVVGGKEMDRADKFIEPTIMIDLPADDPIMKEELFAPILPIIVCESLEEAIQIVKKGEKPLGLYFFSKDKKKIEYVLTHTSSGGVTINDILLHASQDSLPFGGVGYSGMGNYHGKYSFDTFTHEKAVLHRSINDEKLIGVRYPPFTEKKRWWVNKLFDRQPVPFT